MNPIFKQRVLKAIKLSTITFYQFRENDSLLDVYHIQTAEKEPLVDIVHDTATHYYTVIVDNKIVANATWPADRHGPHRQDMADIFELVYTCQSLIMERAHHLELLEEMKKDEKAAARYIDDTILQKRALLAAQHGNKR